VHQFDVIRARLDVITAVHVDRTTGGNHNDRTNTITMMRTLVSPIAHGANGSQSESLKATFDVLSHEMKRAKWIDPLTYELHPVLAKVNTLAYSTTNIFDKLCNPRFIPYAADIVDLFLDRFRPSTAGSPVDGTRVSRTLFQDWKCR
jgi:hypothetical protein